MRAAPRLTRWPGSAGTRKPSNPGGAVPYPRSVAPALPCPALQFRWAGFLDPCGCCQTFPLPLAAGGTAALNHLPCVTSPHQPRRRTVSPVPTARSTRTTCSTWCGTARSWSSAATRQTSRRQVGHMGARTHMRMHTRGFSGGWAEPRHKPVSGGQLYSAGQGPCAFVRNVRADVWQASAVFGCWRG